MTEASSLYQYAIKQFAEAAHGHGLLPTASGEARLDNPLCGDRVRVQVVVVSGRIAAVAQETRGCLLCRAAASVIGLRALGQDEAAIALVVAGVERTLKHSAPTPAAWPELAMFEPARAYASRHRCVLLPFRALQIAMRNASTSGEEVGSAGTSSLLKFGL